ncbi:hypothetical protein BH20CHL7_BH20CHL7_17660 [soil metagenome]
MPRWPTCDSPDTLTPDARHNSFIRAGFRKRGLTRELVRAAADHARRRGARAIEGYPFITQPGKEIAWDEIHVGTQRMFADAGFREVTRPGVRRVVMRIDLD